MAYQLYRNTTLGNSLQESLDELIQVTPSELTEPRRGEGPDVGPEPEQLVSC